MSRLSRGTQIGHSGRRNERGQSMVEMALAFPILLLILAGTLEVGKYFNDYLTFLDATREGARYAADGDLLNNVTEPSSNCDDNFFHQAACLAKQNISGITYDDLADDIVVSAMSVDGTGHIVPNSRFPRPISAGPPPSWMPDYRDGLVSSAEEGWSYCKHIIKTGCTPKTSRFTNAAIEAMLATNPTPPGENPGTGIVIVEIYRLHRQFLGLIPPGLSFLPQEVIMHAYTMMPLPSVAPPPSYTP